MKKLVSLLLTVCMSLSVGVMLTACGHEHTYQTEWSKDATHHWHACEGEDCTEVSDKAEHTWNDGEITTEATADADGVKTFTCTACGQTKTESVQLKTTVTEEEWDEALQFDHTTIQYKGNYYVDSTLDNYSEIYVSGDTVKLVERKGDQTAIDYYEKAEGGYYFYDDQTNASDLDATREYTKEFVSSENGFDDTKNGMKYMLSPLVGNSKEFHCDDNGCYVAEQVADYTDISIWFSDGKISKIHFTWGRRAYELEITYDDISITLPTIAQ